MKRLPLLFLLLAGLAVRCDDSNNYYIVELPRREQRRPFKVYWNVPTMQCKSKKVPFENLYEKFGIIQNANDTFRGNAFVILYDPGLFPALFKNESSGKFRFRNGGVPQEGNLTLHLEEFRMELLRSIPDEGFNGIAVIDFESWRPIFRQNFGVLTPYKEISYQMERKRQPWWVPEAWVKKEAKERFEKYGRMFMEETIMIAKRLRPLASWGYYGFPYCFNRGTPGNEDCSRVTKEENDRSQWLWRSSDALHPSVYWASSAGGGRELALFTSGRVREARRAAGGGAVLPYLWFRYRDAGYMDKEDVKVLFEAIYEAKADGFIIWGSSNDVNSKDKCAKLHDYIYNVFGPMIVNYTKYSVKSYDLDETVEINLVPPNILLNERSDQPNSNVDIININIRIDENSTNNSVKHETINYNATNIRIDNRNNPENQMQNITSTIQNTYSIDAVDNSTKDETITTENSLTSVDDIMQTNTESGLLISLFTTDRTTEQTTDSTTHTNVFESTTEFTTQSFTTEDKDSIFWTTNTDIPEVNTESVTKLENKSFQSDLSTEMTTESHTTTTKDVHDTTTESNWILEEFTTNEPQTYLGYPEKKSRTGKTLYDLNPEDSKLNNDKQSTTELSLVDLLTTEEVEREASTQETYTYTKEENSEITTLGNKGVTTTEYFVSTISEERQGIQDNFDLRVEYHTSTTEKVSKSASTSLEKHKLLICFLLYFTSFARCVCDIFHQCT